MALDGIVCSKIVTELNQTILNGKINQIYEPNKNEILLGIYSMGKNYQLLINISPESYRCHLTYHQKDHSKNAPAFCMALRKRLMGGVIKKISMNGLERILYLDIECHNELNFNKSRTLIIELMGKHSNLILVDEKQCIIESLKHLNKQDGSLRDIFPGCQYVPIKNLKKDFLFTSFENFFSNLKEIKGTLSSQIADQYIGISRLGISYLLDSLSLSDSTLNSQEEYETLFQAMKSLIQSNYCFPVEYQNDFYIQKSDHPTDITLNQWIDDFYAQKELQKTFSNTQKHLLSLIFEKTKKLQLKLNKINHTLQECYNIEKYKLYGELIISNLYQFPKENNSSIVLEDYYHTNTPIEIPLDPSLSPSLNAEKYFKKYKKLQNAFSISQKQKELIESEIAYLDSITYEITTSLTLDELNDIREEIYSYLEVLPPLTDSMHIKKKNIASIFPAQYQIDGYTVYVGKNNKQNDYLTCKLAQKSDLWFHTQEIHGSHVVLKLPKKISHLPDATVYKCACIAAFFSKAKLSQNVPVDYTYVKYVKKPNGAKTGMVIYTDQKTLYVNPKNPVDC